MAGPGNSEDNPIAINVTALVDIIFCLCLFFMCSLHFKQVEGKIDAWMPRDHGNNPQVKAERCHLEEIRVLMRSEPDGSKLVRKIGSRPPVASDAELISVVTDMADMYRRAGKEYAPVAIDATEEVAWRDIVRVMDLCRKNQLDHIELVEPLQGPVLRK